MNRSGFTLVELMIVMAILVVAILGFVFGLGVSIQEVSASKQSYMALNAARSKIEELKGEKFRYLYTDFGPGSAGQTFAVTYEEEGKTFVLEPQGGGNGGTITFYTDETSIPASFEWETTYDLNGDGDSADADVSSNYKILPVMISIAWEDSYGARVEEVRTILFDPKYPKTLD